VANRRAGRLQLPEISPPVRLEASAKAVVRAYVSRMSTSIGEEEFFYIAERIGSKLELLRDSRLHWVKDLRLVAVTFHLALRDHVEGRAAISAEVVHFLAVGLHYLVNPFDVIPDHVSGDGYLDDAFVMNECVKRITRKDDKVLSSYVRTARQL
jgi:uncharacterized membrane protein YkvA (DUF1232 family)